MGRKGTYADPTGNAVVRHDPDHDRNYVDSQSGKFDGDEPIDLNQSAHERRITIDDLDAKQYYLLKGHSIRLLEIGDKYVVPNMKQGLRKSQSPPFLPGRLVTVKNVKRSRQGGKEVTLDNGYTFDSMLPAHDDHDIDIYRPRKGF